jgi:hypothetical protein
MNPKIEGKLVSKALRIDELNRETRKTIVQNDFKKLFHQFGEFEELKKDIKSLLMHFPVAKIHDQKAKNIIRKISLGEFLMVVKYPSKN